MKFNVISDAVGFALVKLPAALNESYERYISKRGGLDAVRQLHGLIKHVDAANYRGLERCPLSKDPIVEPWSAGNAEHYRAVDERDTTARLRFMEIVGSQDVCAPSANTVPTLEHARELLSLVDSPANYEIVRLTKALPETARKDSHLGFDVGYWTGDSYSILCDSAIWPVWHPPPVDAFVALSQQLRDLNSHCLFPTYEAAHSFRSWYLLQDWAETERESGEFCIISIDAIK